MTAFANSVQVFKISERLQRVFFSLLSSVMAQTGKFDDPVQRQEIIAFLKTEDPTIDLCPE